MKNTILLVLLAFIGLSTANAQVGIGTTDPDPSAKLEVDSPNNDKGFLPPRLTTAQRDAIASPAEGLTIYNTDNKCLETYNGASWISLCDGSLLTIANDCPNQSPTAIVEVQAAGYTWMDRNLGASRVAQSSTDFEAYGNLFQWGRNRDGHECINWTSSTTSDGAEQSNESTSQSTSPNPGSTFIAIFGNWYNGTNPDDLWKSDLTGVNNPCPAGYRVPSKTELEDLGITSANDAYTKLKMPKGGRRLQGTGALDDTGNAGNYWTSTVRNNNAWYLYFNGFVTVVDDPRVYGMAVRCIKD